MLAKAPAFHKQVDLASYSVSPETVTLELDNGEKVPAGLAALQQSCKVIADASSACKICDVLMWVTCTRGLGEVQLHFAWLSDVLMPLYRISPQRQVSIAQLHNFVQGELCCPQHSFASAAHKLHPCCCSPGW